MTVDDVICRLPFPAMSRLPAPSYVGTSGEHRIGLAVESMRRHTSDEGFQLFAALQHAGYELMGHNLPIPITDVSLVCERMKSGVVVLQDKREWDGQTAGPGHDRRERFTNVGALKSRPDLFKLTVLKDAHQKQAYHRESADEIGCHAWVCYYHPRIVARLAPYVRQEHLVRTYHSIDPAIIPPYSSDRSGCILSGAVSGAYPLRLRLSRGLSQLPGVTYYKHPGYRRDGCRTPDFLKELSKYRVAIVTASMYGYALRKLVEATAAGCAVITDLPCDEVMPVIDGNLHRVPSDSSPQEVGQLVKRLEKEYDPERQRRFSEAASWYDYRAVGLRLAQDIEEMRRSYLC